MSFVYGKYFILVLIAIILLFWLSRKVENQFFRWVEQFWFYKRSRSSFYSWVFNLIGISLLLISLLDLRGKTENITAKIPEQKTILLIDVSLSMLAEDVRPSRLEKAVQVAKHFVRKSAGHNVSIMIFSDTTKQLIPFTKDIDLLDARLNALKELDLNRGGSNIRRAIQESLSYFKTSKGVVGNILVISDSDETVATWDLEIPDTVSVGFVAVGTAKGSRIPLRRRNGILQGYKKHNGKEVISKLNETELKSLKDKIENFEYWVLGSYSIPTEALLSFFDKSHKEKFSESQTLVRPVLMEYVVVPGVLALIVSYLFKLQPTFYIPCLIFLSLNLSFSVIAQEKKSMEEFLEEQKAQKLKEVESNPLFHKFKAGKAKKDEKLKVAELYMRAEASDRALKVYRENLSSEDFSKSENFNTYFNYGTSLMENGKIKEGVELFQDLKEKAASQEQKDKITKNLLALLKKDQQQKQQQQNGKNKQNKKDQQQGQQQQQQSQSGQDQKENQESEQKNQGSENDQKQDQNPSNGQQNQEKNKKDSPGDLARKKKLPIMLKQLIDKDRKLQEKLLDTETKKKRSLDQKDW